MKRCCLGMLTLTLSLASLLPALAADEAKQDTKKRGFGRGVAVFTPRSMNLNDDQKAKLEAINKEFAPKLEPAEKKIAALMTEERRQAMRKVFEGAKDSGKSFAELRAAAVAAMQLSEQEQKDYDAAHKELEELRKAAREQFSACLTAEQKEQLNAPRKKREAK